MKKIQDKLSLVLPMACALLLCSCANIETQRYATIDRSEGSIFAQVSGFNSSPLTAEGAFPRWSNDLKVFMKPGVEIPKTGRREFQAEKDFTAQHDVVESGTIVVDEDAKRVEVNVTYTKDYRWNRTTGRFPIKEEK